MSVLAVNIHHVQDENIIKGQPIALKRQDRKLQIFLKIQKEYNYLLKSGLPWSNIPSMTPMKEPGPLSLVEE